MIIQIANSKIRIERTGEIEKVFYMGIDVTELLDSLDLCGAKIWHVIDKKVASITVINELMEGAGMSYHMTAWLELPIQVEVTYLKRDDSNIEFKATINGDPVTLNQDQIEALEQQIAEQAEKGFDIGVCAA